MSPSSTHSSPSQASSNPLDRALERLAAGLLADPPGQRHPLHTLRRHEELPEGLDYGVFTTGDKSRAAVYANNWATPQNPPVVFAIDADALKPLSDADARLDFVDDSIREVLREALEPAQRYLAGDEAAYDELYNELTQYSGDYGEDEDNTVMSGIFRSQPVSGEAILEHLEAQGLDQRGVAETVVRIVETGEIPDALLATMTNQYRYPHDVPTTRLLWAELYYPWRDEPIDDDEYEELEADARAWVFDEDGYVLFSQEGAIEASDYGWLPERGKIWENPQLRFEGFEPQRVQYHGTTYDKALEILEGQMGWTGLRQELVTAPAQQSLEEAETA